MKSKVVSVLAIGKRSCLITWPDENYEKNIREAIDIFYTNKSVDNSTMSTKGVKTSRNSR